MYTKVILQAFTSIYNLNPLNPLVFQKRETPSINNVDRWSQILSCENVIFNGDSGENKPYWQVKTSILPVLSEPLHVTKSEGPNVCGTKTSPPGRAKRWPERVEPPGQEQWSENVDSTCQKRGISPGSGIQLIHQQQKWWFHIFHRQKMGIQPMKTGIYWKLWGCLYNSGSCFWGFLQLYDPRILQVGALGIGRQDLWKSLKSRPIQIPSDTHLAHFPTRLPSLPGYQWSHQFEAVGRSSKPGLVESAFWLAAGNQKEFVGRPRNAAST